MWKVTLTRHDIEDPELVLGIVAETEFEDRYVAMDCVDQINALNHCSPYQSTYVIATMMEIFPASIDGDARPS